MDARPYVNAAAMSLKGKGGGGGGFLSLSIKYFSSLSLSSMCRFVHRYIVYDILRVFLSITLREQATKKTRTTPAHSLPSLTSATFTLSGAVL